MHNGCMGSFDNGKQVVDKVRQMGFAAQQVPIPLDMTCVECSNDFTMETFEAACPSCGMIYGVTPCHAFDSANVAAAGVGYK